MLSIAKIFLFFVFISSNANPLLVFTVIVILVFYFVLTFLFVITTCITIHHSYDLSTCALHLCGL